MKFCLESFHQLHYQKAGKQSEQSSKSEDSVPDHRFCRKLILIFISELQDIQWPNNETPARSLMAAHNFCDLSPPQLQKQSMLSHITTISSQVICLHTPKLIFHFEIFFTSKRSQSEVDRNPSVKVTHLWICRTVTCVAAQREKTAFLLKTLLLEEMLLFICSYHGLLSRIVPGPSLPRFLVWQAQTDGRTMTIQGFVGKGGNIPG